MNIKLLIFAKHPTPGKVMTRLCPPLSHDDAARIQRACIRMLCERSFRGWPVRPTLVISPDDAEDETREFVGPYIPIATQGEGDLGERLSRVCKAQFDAGEKTLLIIGTDSPTMPFDTPKLVMKKLGKSDVVVGPTEDGGYYCIGLRKFDKRLFTNIDWSSDRVFEQTQAQAKQCKFKFDTLPEWYDIDRPEDVGRAVADIVKADHRDDFELRRVLQDVIEHTPIPKKARAMS